MIFVYQNYHLPLMRFIRLGLILLFPVLFLTLPPPTALAAGPEVNSHLDENDHSCSDGDCSLRDAIETAAAGQTVTFAAGLSGQTSDRSFGMRKLEKPLKTGKQMTAGEVLTGAPVHDK